MPFYVYVRHEQYGEWSRWGIYRTRDEAEAERERPQDGGGYLTTEIIEADTEEGAKQELSRRTRGQQP